MPHASPVAILTGAGSGIGRATAVALSRAGYALVIAGRRREALTQTAAMCADPRTVEVVGADLIDERQCVALVRRAVDRFGRLDALVHNAGAAAVAPISATTTQMLDAAFHLNVYATAWLTREAFAVFADAHRANADARSVIVNISSVASVDPFPGFFVYAASKAAMNLLTLTAANEGARIGIKAFAVAPGATETPMLRSAFDEKMLPREQTMTPDTVAAVVVECLTGKRDHQNGRVIPVLPAAARDSYAKFLREHPPIQPA